VTCFKNPARHMYQRYQQFAGTSLLQTLTTKTFKIFLRRPSAPGRQSNYRAKRDFFSVWQRIFRKIEGTEIFCLRGQFNNVGQFFTTQTVTLDFDSTSFNVLVLFGQFASWTILGSTRKRSTF